MAQIHESTVETLLFRKINFKMKALIHACVRLNVVTVSLIINCVYFSAGKDMMSWKCKYFFMFNSDNKELQFC